MTSLTDGILEFLAASPTPFHATSNMATSLESAGYLRLNETDVWKCQPGGRYFVTRNGSSLVAFGLGENHIEQGFRMVGAHTDSPCLKLKPQPEILRKGYLQLGVEVYGGALLNPWFDRDLGIAGRVAFRQGRGEISSTLIDFGAAVAFIPSLAIHLDREANKNRTVNAQLHLPPVLQLVDEKPDFREIVLNRIRSQKPDLDAKQILDFDLSLYDTQRPALVGLENEFIASARLDNLLSCYLGLQSLLNDEDGESRSRLPAMLVCTDHEEVGSQSAAGAQGPFLRSILERLCPGSEAVTRMVSKSMLISADNAHAIHPNYDDKHDHNHGPEMNGGPVIKVNANQRYASNAQTTAIFRQLCEEAGVPVQDFVTRSDLGCGSTIGPITASEIGIRTVDVGIPQLAMHSIREIAGIADCEHLYSVLSRFYGYSLPPL
jgi:aspartyl aminopeptidase